MLLAMIRDIVSPKRFLYFFLSLLLLAGIRLTSSVRIEAFSVQVLLVFLLTYLSSIQLYQSYFTYERMTGYYHLPLEPSVFQLEFMTLTFLLNSIERLSFFLFFLDYSKQTVMGVAYLFLSSLLAVLVSFIGFRWWQTDWPPFYKTAIIFLSAVASLCLLLLRNPFLVGSSCILLLFYIYKKASLLYLSNARLTGEIPLAWRENYFLVSLLRNHSFWYNSLFLLIFAGILLTFDYPLSLKIPLLFTLFSLNTPLTTLISVDKDLQLQLKMLPKPSPFYWMYAQVLIVYYLIVNSLLGIFLITQEMQFDAAAFLIRGIALTVIETIGALILEWRFPIKTEVLVRDVWKHPRKYILPTVIFLLLALFS